MSAVTPYDPNNIALFQPNQVAGLALWLDAADSSTISCINRESKTTTRRLSCVEMGLTKVFSE